MSGWLTTLKAALIESVSNRRAFLFQAAVMVVNDLVWIGFWVVFFHKAGTVRGWNVDQIVLLQAVLTTGGGVTLGIVANARHVGTMVTGGGLDALLSLPAHPLAQLLVRRIEPVNLGDLVFGVGLFAVAGHPTPTRTLVFLGASTASAVLLTSFLVLTGSLAFFGGRADSGELGFSAMLMLSNYPVNVFAGLAKLLLYTVVPAAFVATVPAQLIDRFDLGRAVAMLLITAIFATAAVAVFNLGLRRYTSGSVWTRA